MVVNGSNGALEVVKARAFYFNVKITCPFSGCPYSVAGLPLLWE
jgi:hypothetical protein